MNDEEMFSNSDNKRLDVVKDSVVGDPLNMWAAMSGWFSCLGLLLNYTVVSITLCRRVIGPRCHNTKKRAGRARRNISST